LPGIVFILCPGQGIVADVCPNLIKRFFVSDDVIVKRSLPDFSADIELIGFDVFHIRNGAFRFEGPDNLTQARAAALHLTKKQAVAIEF